MSFHHCCAALRAAIRYSHTQGNKNYIVAPLKFSFEGAVEDGGEQGVQFGGGLGLQARQRVHFRLQSVQFGHDPALLG